MKKHLLIGISLIYLYILPISAETIKLYVTYAQSYTSIEQFIAAEDLKGATLAVEMVNQNGGILGMEVDLINGMATSFAMSKEIAIENLKTMDITAVVGANNSNMTMLIAPLFQEERIPIISPISTHPDITSIGDYVFRACFTDPFQGKIMAAYAKKNLAAKTAVILTKGTSTFSLSISEFFSSEFSNGGRVIAQEYYNADQGDFSEVLLKVKDLSPDVVFVPGHGSDSGLIMRQAFSMGIDSIFLGGDGWGKGALGVAGAEAAEGHYFVNHWHQDVDSPISRDFVDRYHAKYGEGAIAGSAALAFDAANIIFEAIERAGSTDGEAIRNAIASTTNFRGVTGNITMEYPGEPMNKPGVIMKYTDGEIVFVELVSP